MTSEGRTGIRGEIKGPGGKGPGLKRALRALKHREFAIFWSGALASNTGTWIQNMTVPYVLYQITESAFWVGFATFAQFVPQMVLGPLGGSIADRSDRRKVLIITQAAMAVAAEVAAEHAASERFRELVARRRRRLSIRPATSLHG